VPQSFIPNGEIMKKLNFLLSVFACTVVVFMALSVNPAPVDAAGISKDSVFVIGRITENPKKHHAALEEMGAYIMSHLKDLGYTSMEVVMVKSIDEMIRLMHEGKVDAISETAFSTVRLIDEAGAQALLREWKKGVASYKTVFFAAKDGDVETLADLKDKRVAFEDPGSTSAFLVPFATLRQAGLVPVELTAIDRKPPADKVGYAFTSDEMTQLMWVARGIADAGAFSDLNWQDYQDNRMVTDNLKIIHEGVPILRSVFSVRGDLPEAVKARIAATLMAMADDDVGRKILDVYNKVKQYDRLEGDEMAKSLTNIRQLSEMLK